MSDMIYIYIYSKNSSEFDFSFNTTASLFCEEQIWFFYPRLYNMFWNENDQYLTWNKLPE
jgi:hypothetical protein